MSDTSSFGFGKFVPGFDFLQNLATSAVKGAPSNIPQMPNLTSWVAPTLNVEELDKRIDELKTVQFWLDQNALALKATIQALEVQKMTLATLKGMNFSMSEVANAFKLKPVEPVTSEAQKAAEKAASTAEALSAAASAEASAADAAAEAAEHKREPADKTADAGKPAAEGVVDPMQWWGALTQQFQQIATSAMQEAAKQPAFDTTRNMATEAIKTATDMATSVTRGAARKAASPARPAKTAARKAPAKAPRKTPQRSG
jgi:hypothetical protein